MSTAWWRSVCGEARGVCVRVRGVRVRGVRVRGVQVRGVRVRGVRVRQPVVLHWRWGRVFYSCVGTHNRGGCSRLHPHGWRALILLLLSLPVCCQVGCWCSLVVGRRPIGAACNCIRGFYSSVGSHVVGGRVCRNWGSSSPLHPHGRRARILLLPFPSLPLASACASRQGRCSDNHQHRQC